MYFFTQIISTLYKFVYFIYKNTPSCILFRHTLLFNQVNDLGLVSQFSTTFYRQSIMTTFNPFNKFNDLKFLSLARLLHYINL